MRGIGLVFAGSLIVASCTSGADQVAVPPPSPDLTVETTDPPVTTAPPTPAPTTVPDSTEPPVTTVPSTVASTTAPPATAPPTTEPPAPRRPTIDELLDSGRVLHIAHAGGEFEGPHSTFFAYDNAVAVGADMLEMDVLLTADGVLIVQHDDDTLERTTNDPRRPDALTFAELVELDAGYWFAESCWRCDDLPEEEYVYRGVRTGDVPPPEGAEPDDFRIVSFAEMVERYPDMAFDIEIKGRGDVAAAVAAALADEIERYDLGDHVVVASFDDATIELFHSFVPDVHVSPAAGALAAWLLEGEPLDEIYRIIQVPPVFGEVPVITPEFWDAVDEAGVAVWVWPNDAALENAGFYQELIDQGASGIIAGRPSQVP